MAISRRTFLGLGALGAALATVGGVGWRWLRERSVPQLQPQQERLLRACVDALVPADEHGPGALDLGIDQELIVSARTDARLRRIILRGAETLEPGGAAFADLAPEEQIRRLRRAEAAPVGSAPRRLFDHLRATTFERFYARPESWASLGYPGPPQPAGYMDFQQPPPRRS